MKSDLKWDYDLLIEMSKLLNPLKPPEWHTRKNIRINGNHTVRTIQKLVKEMLTKLPPDTFLRSHGAVKK